MPNRLMRKAASSSLLPRTQRHVLKATSAATFLTNNSTVAVTPAPCTSLHRRFLANVTAGGSALPEVWFTSQGPRLWSEEHVGKKGEPPDERTLKLGKTLRILQDHMPTLLQTPLPQEILSPHITLHLFPSTHPHLPAVSGRVAYIAALWTAPMAWGRVPIVGNVKLHVLSERMAKTSLHASPASSNNSNAEKLIVRWKTCGKSAAATAAAGQGDAGFSDVRPGSASSSADDGEFYGLFIFEFDELGRVLHHTIEHVDEGANWDRNTARVISVTEWLLSKAKGGGRKAVEEEGLALGCCEIAGRRGRDRRRD
ncbi:hypothetical protein FGG08_005031 [Glutinoglossum americanum]|uniref:Uncharacterized protein n=1 Tax=Glutinoglossum americanum TaxID=1670608 RepID=A0A9P8L264_9PEZI|nr:hypothetical protein FGG08_005031 [Glutinoglossum americanum]